ncbi:MAG: (S)-ureidoglycine aminohydrolase [Tepidisphaeraceae bacterium]
MRPHHSLVHSRTRLTPRYALFPLEGYPFSRLPTWPDAQVRVLASPAIGAGFVQYLIDLPAGKRGEFAADGRAETFFYVLKGKGTLTSSAEKNRPLTPGSFGLLPPDRGLAITAKSAMQILVHRQIFKPVAGIDVFKPLLSHESEVKSVAWADTDKIQLQTLIPDEFQFDLAVNIFAFTPGFGLPITETHVMEHGALILQGKGVYRLGDDWTEVEKDDYLWMGPYCPQSFYATGDVPAKYIYTKDVNREIEL